MSTLTLSELFASSFSSWIGAPVDDGTLDTGLLVGPLISPPKNELRGETIPGLVGPEPAAGEGLRTMLPTMLAAPGISDADRR